MLMDVLKSFFLIEKRKKTNSISSSVMDILCDLGKVIQVCTSTLGS